MPLKPNISFIGLSLVIAFLFLCRFAFAIESKSSQIPTAGKQMILSIYQDERAILNALAMIESSNNPNARGDIHSQDGPALGLYQLHQSAWMDISDIRKKNNLPVYPYHDALVPERAQEYALTLLRAIKQQFKTYHASPPSPRLLYACYSLGPAILSKIPYMDGLYVSGCPLESSGLCTPMVDTVPLSSVGYKLAIVRRKMNVGLKFENLLYAHHISMRESGLPLLWH